jgi:restriction system protein
MDGRTDKGIVITTSTFTSEAGKEAARDGARTIDLIDGEMLCDLLRQYSLGVKTVEAYEIEPGFFEAI